MSELFYVVNKQKIFGAHHNLSGDYSKLRGDCSNIWGKCFNIRGFVSNLIGDISNLNGDVSHIRGNISVNIFGNFSSIYGDITGIEGNVSNLTGDLDRCKLSKYERNSGVDIKYLRGRYSFFGTKTYREHYDINGNEKYPFESESEVLNFLRYKQRNSKGNEPSRIYQCPYCYKWHFGRDYDK